MREPAHYFAAPSIVYNAFSYKISQYGGFSALLLFLPFSF